MYACIYELWKNCCGRTDGRVDGWTSKVLQEVLADLKSQNIDFIDRDFAKDCLLTLAKSRLALGPPGWLFVIMPKMAEHTEKLLLTVPSTAKQALKTCGAFSQQIRPRIIFS